MLNDTRFLLPAMGMWGISVLPHTTPFGEERPFPERRISGRRLHVIMDRSFALTSFYRPCFCPLILRPDGR